MNIVVLMTTNDQGEARSIANALVEEKLAACVNIIPAVESVYYWDGKMCSDNEFLLIAKTQKSLFAKLEERVKAMHSYDVPEIIALPIEAGSENYLNWLVQTTERKS